jgi:hypothetical protein
MSPRQHRIRKFAGGWRSVATAFAAVALLVVGFAPSASAHVEIDVGDGQYVMEIGFRDEPAFLGQPNAVFVHVERYATGGTEPVEGLAATLTAEVTKDGQSFSPPLAPTGEGSYEAVFVPTALGDYTFRISGTIEDAPVDETVTSGPSTFNSVEPLSAIEFPATEADAAQVQESLASAQSDAATARTLAIAGIAAGLLGLIVAAVAFSRAGKAAPAVVAAPASANEPPGKLIR